MVKKLITFMIFGMLLVGSAAFAQSTSTATSTPGSTSSTNQVHKENSACVQAAVAKRNTAISTAQDVFKKALSDARSLRNSALKSLGQSTSTDKTANRTARRAAQKTYQDAVKAAQKAFRDAGKAAQDKYKIERRACRTSQLPSQETACPQILSPVCGSDNKSYDNECYAKIAGVKVQYRGNCGKPFPCSDQNADFYAKCGEGFSCWYELPRGPKAGIPGSKEKPGVCWSNKVIESIY